MVVEMKKGNKLVLDKGMKKAHLGLNWDVRKTPGADYDLDLFFVLVGADGRAAYGDSNNSLVFYGHKKNNERDPSIYVLEDNLTGADTGSGPGYFDEEGFVIFEKVPAEIKEIVAAVSIYDYAARNQNFGQVNNAKYDIMDGDTNAHIASGDLSEDMSNFTGISVCRFRREADGTWSVKAIQEPVPNGMAGIIIPYGMSV